jgi:hypothetical protein
VLIVVDTAACAALVPAVGTPYVRIAFARLLQAYLDGLHVLAFPPPLCAAIEANSDFSADERAAAKKARQKYAEHGGLCRHVSVFGRVVDGPPALQPARAGQVWNIPLRWLANQPLHETQLVAEDLHDVNVLTAAAEDSLNNRRLFAFRVRVCAVPGGGANTSRVRAEGADRATYRHLLCRFRPGVSERANRSNRGKMQVSCRRRFVRTPDDSRPLFRKCIAMAAA